VAGESTAAAPAAAATWVARRERTARWAAAAVLWAAAQFLVLAAVAMALYPGGNDTNEAAAGYSFIRNFFSDLGATHSYSGRPNTAANVLFIVALVCVGLTLVSFGFAARSLRPRNGRAGLVAAVAPAAATISGLAFVGIAATPWDLALGAHLICVDAAFGFLLVFVACLAVLQAAAGWRRGLIAANVVYCVLLAGYVALLFLGPRTGTDAGLIVQVVAQKAIVYASILNLGLQAAGLLFPALGQRRRAVEGDAGAETR
jgi:hypothetical protein